MNKKIYKSTKMCKQIHISVEHQVLNMEKIFRRSEELMQMSQELKKTVNVFKL
ncbi:hypothetical protein [Defluviitalea phaphyphila]|uniref:hypothetical protein n=1 Tax=Defluviitalea phaphyphila TaxID=1473580 RepID=UPI001365C32B|nr:hypothetical protein [Defluviitalea phaphyphila]